MSYFFSDQALRDLVVGQVVPLPERVFHHAVRVRRARPGETLTLFDGSGAAWHTTLVAINKREAMVKVEAQEESPSSTTAPPLRLALALIAADRLDWALQKATELGAASFQLITCERSAPLNKLERRLEHWQGVIIAACEQSHRLVLPTVLEPLSLPLYLARAPGIMLDADSDSDLPSAMSLIDGPLLIGPEGGFSAEERQKAKAAGWQSAHLGGNILRAETAAVAAATLACLGRRGTLNNI